MLPPLPSPTSPKGVKVCKFGGTSLADATQQRKVKAIVESDPTRRYVVPSAPGKRHKQDQKITDLLYLCHEHARQGLPIEGVWDLIAQRYRQIVADLGLSLDLSPQLEETRLRIASRAPADYCASRGEYLNGLVVAALLGFDFIDAAEVVFFDRRGRFDAEKTQRVLSRRLAKSARAVIPGFYGSLPDGTVKTFSRGGSDITGAIVARGASAEVYENWTDVSGMLIADPRIVENAKPIEVVTYRELRELAYMGATVLHDESVFPVREAGIPVNIRNTNAPLEPGSLILPERQAPPPKAPVTGIAGRKDFTVILIEKAMMNLEVGFGRRVLSILEVNGIRFEHMPTGIDTLSLVLADSEIEPKLERVVEELKQEVKPDSVEVIPHMALIATVGRGMANTPGTAARLFKALGDARINIRMIDQGSSEQNIIVGVAEADFEGAVRAIYSEFVR